VFFFCTVTACPAEFGKIEGIPNRCFYSHLNSHGSFINVPFEDALKICKGKNAIVAEPTSSDEGFALQRYELKIFQATGSGTSPWINYHDIVDKAALVGKDNSVFMTSHYMGSLSTMNKMPKSWWAPYFKEGTFRQRGHHCAMWTNKGVYDINCNGPRSLLCEIKTSSQNSLKDYIENLNDVVAA